MRVSKRVAAIIEKLKELYPEAVCQLNSGSAFQLLVATRLSAQCTDARVNLITPALFARFPDAKSMASAQLEEVEELIKSCGLYRTKARDIILMSQMLMQSYGGVVPDTLEELTKLPGVGRKTANLIVGDVYGKPSYVTDTHVIRICNLLGLADSKDPLKVEMQLRKVIPPEESGDFCHRIVLHGRAVCVARSPKCGACGLSHLCPSAKIGR